MLETLSYNVFLFKKVKESSPEGFSLFFFPALFITSTSERRGDININTKDTKSLIISVLVGICVSVPRDQLGKFEKI